MWKLTTEGASHQPEGLWPEGWCEAPEVGNDTHAQHTWVGVTFMHMALINLFRLVRMPVILMDFILESIFKIGQYFMKFS